MTAWLSICIEGLVLLIGLAVQGLGVAYFIGRMKEHADGQSRLLDSFKAFNQQTIDAMLRRLEAGDNRFAMLNSEIVANKVSIAKMETGLESHEAGCEERQRRNDEGFRSVNARFDSVMAQIQAIARGELTKLSKGMPRD